MHENFSVRFVFRVKQRSFWAMNHGILGWILKVRVRVFSPEKREEREGEEGRKRKNERNEGIRVRSLLYKALDRVGSDPIQRPTPSTFRSRSYWIRINPTPLMRSGDPDPPTVWVWAGYPRSFGFLFSFLIFLLCAPLFLLFGPHVRLIFLQKFLKNYHVFLDVF